MDLDPRSVSVGAGARSGSSCVCFAPCATSLPRAGPALWAANLVRSVPPIGSFVSDTLGFSQVSTTIQFTRFTKYRCTGVARPIPCGVGLSHDRGSVSDPFGCVAVPGSWRALGRAIARHLPFDGVFGIYPFSPVLSVAADAFCISPLLVVPPPAVPSALPSGSDRGRGRRSVRKLLALSVRPRGLGVVTDAGEGCLAAALACPFWVSLGPMWTCCVPSVGIAPSRWGWQAVAAANATGASSCCGRRARSLSGELLAKR